MNIVMLIGNLATEPKVSVVQTANGEAKVINFVLAVNRVFNKNMTNNETAFISCEAWDTGAEHIANNFKVGDRMFVQGSLKTEQWEKDGQKQKRDKVRVSHFERVVLSKTNTE